MVGSDHYREHEQQLVADEFDIEVSDELVHSLLNASSQGIYGVDMEGHCTFTNPGCLELLGFESHQELLGKNMHTLIHHTRPDGSVYDPAECQIFQAFREGRGTHVEDEIVWRADGTSLPVEYWSHPIHRGDELVGCVITFVDISERKQAEYELRESEQMVRSLLAATGEGIYGVDLNGDCTFANPSCIRLLGCDDESSVLGKNMHALIHHTRPDGSPYPVEECQIYQAFRDERGTHIGDEIVWRLDGESFPAEYWSYPVHHGDELVGSVVTFVDISERRRQEEELRQTEKMSALGKLSAGLAHELNNPAAAARRAAEQLGGTLDRLHALSVKLGAHGLDGAQWQRLTAVQTELTAFSGAPSDDPLAQADREEAVGQWLDSHGVAEPWQLAPSLAAAGLDREALERIGDDLPAEALGDAVAWIGESLAGAELAATIAESTTRMSDLVGAVKSYSYMDQAPEQEIDVHDGIENTITILGHKVKQGVTITREYDRTLPKLTLLGGELNQVWTNLLDNAIDAAGPQGEICISTSRDEHWFVVEIADNGPGIPVDVQPRIFDPFFTTKEVGEGTGLGLDVARRIVTERCNGEIEFESQPGDTRFRVRLPIPA